MFNNFDVNAKNQIRTQTAKGRGLFHHCDAAEDGIDLTIIMFFI